MDKREKALIAQSVKSLVGPDGLVTRKTIVAAARSPASPLHPRFEWRDKVAAEKYREAQAGELLRVFVTFTETGQVDPSRVFVSLTADRTEPGGGYRVIDEVVRSPAKYATLRHDAVQVLRGARRTYAKVRELKPLWKLVDALGD